MAGALWRTAAIAALMLALPTAAGAAPARIAFDSGDDVALVNADGSGRTILVHEPGAIAADPSWSPDGTRLALSVSEDENLMARIDVVRTDGSGLTRITPLGSRGTFEFAPDWSPDGTRIAFVRLTFARGRLVSSVVVANADGSGAHTLVTLRLRAFSSIADLTWTPDGMRVVYTRKDLDDNDFFRPSVWSVLADGSGRHRVMRDAGSPSFSPDGARVAYIGETPERKGQLCFNDSGCELPGHLYVSDADGASPRPLRSGAGRDSAPAWSPDGARILFSSTRNYPRGEQNEELYSVTPDGACLTWVTNGAPGSDFPDWEPGSGLSSNPGACGATTRAPSVNVDLSGAFGFKRAPVYWIGPIAPDGMLLSETEPGHEGVGLDYRDCGAFDPSGCPKETFDIYSTRACSSTGTVLEQLDGPLRMQRGALVVGGRASAYVWTGRTVVYILGRGGRDPLLGQLRPLGADGPPAQLPPAALPNRLWRQLDRYARSKRPGKARRARAIRRTLTRSGVGHLRC